MKNIVLNPGGILGALALGGLAAVFVFMNIEKRDGNPRTKIIVLAIIGGAFAGNFLWDLLFKKHEQASESFPEQTDGIDPAGAEQAAPRKGDLADQQAADNNAAEDYQLRSSDKRS
ncbi:MAG: hypothetical protein RMI91_14595 [Gemmatales bacterium]|nr:hypothetical protein [Gemmatales bacterium]MCS7168617.1 hypothetical protein [Gemmatales bacterium]MDW7995874.1 hypothetical protein [Gemmatales bacterium]MDW8221532.1 hypothetical protein [Gemmatales bacterium]